MKRNLAFSEIMRSPLVITALLCGMLLLSGFFALAADDDGDALSREAVAKELALVHNHPNPFNAHTTIYYNLLEPSYVTVDIFDMAGHWVDTIWDGMQDDGENFAIWKTDVDPSGTYIYRVKVGDVFVYKKMSLVK